MKNGRRDSMSAKNLDPKGRLRSETIAYRCSPAERKELDKRWKLLGYATKQDYVLDSVLHNKVRFKDISNNSKLLYGLMLDRMSLSVRSGWFDEENRVYIKYSLKSIMEDLNCSKMTAVSLLKELQAIGLVDIEQRNGLANIIYVKNFVSGGEEALDRSENCTGKKKEPVKDDQSNNQTSIKDEE